MEHTLRLRKGAWTSEEDNRLRACIEKTGEGQWHRVPMRAGLNRCRKSCRLRWLNYLKPTIKRGNFSLDEVDLIMRMHNLLGNRWALIAGRLPGRTSNDIKNYWNYRHRKQLISAKENITPKITRHNIIKPRPHKLSPNYFFSSEGIRFANTVTAPINTLPEQKLEQICNNDAFEENVEKQIETNAGNSADSTCVQDNSSYGDLYFDDVELLELYDVLHDDYPLL